MKHRLASLTVILALVLLFAAVTLAAAFAAPDTPELILFTFYRQSGWGDSVDIGAVDSSGRLFVLNLGSGAEVPYGAEDLLTWLEFSAPLEEIGRLSERELFSLRGLVNAVPEQELRFRVAACDAGTQCSYAVRSDGNGGRVCILLGSSGDEVFENTDPAAQALYVFLRERFENVRDFRDDPMLTPAGFQPVPLLTFCGYEGLNLTSLTEKAYLSDCEAGPSETEGSLTARDFASLTVTGMANADGVTGSTILYAFENADGQTVAQFEFYRGLLVTRYGMFYVK